MTDIQKAELNKLINRGGYLIYGINDTPISIAYNTDIDKNLKINAEVLKTINQTFVIKNYLKNTLIT